MPPSSRAYAAFTARQAEAVLSAGMPAGPCGGGEKALLERAGAGTPAARAAAVSAARDEAMTVARALYRMIGVDFRGCGARVHGFPLLLRRGLLAGGLPPDLIPRYAGLFSRPFRRARAWRSRSASRKARPSCRGVVA